MVNLMRMDGYNYMALMRFESDSGPKKWSLQLKKCEIYLDLKCLHLSG